MRLYRKMTFYCVLLCMWIGTSAPAQQDAAALIGKRADEALARFPVVDRVVLVPDEATYLDEIGQWSPDGVWPVLMEDNRLTPMFVRSFHPEQVIRRKSVGDRKPPPVQRRAILERTTVRMWGGNVRQPNIRATFEQAGHVPVGVVLTSSKDDAFFAALPLCALRGQPAIWYDQTMPRANAEVKPDRLNDLLQQQIIGLNELAYPYAALGDAIDAITICRNLPGKVNVTKPDSPNTDRRALTDVLGRGPEGKRFAFTGWIFGDARYCAYAAMCSLFLTHDEMLGVNTYRLSAASGKSDYDQQAAAEMLRENGWTCTVRQGNQASEWGYLASLPGGTNADLLLYNTRGNRNFFRMYDEADCHPGDLPTLNVPALVHFIHSWSAVVPENPASIAAQWRARGAYAYVGSMHEPGLGGFVSPEELTRRMLKGEPFLVAARHIDSPVWRINTFGDPLVTLRSDDEVQRTTPKPDSRDLRERLKTVLRIADRKPSPDAFAEALQLCNLFGEDEVATQLWRIAQAKPNAADAHVAQAALGPLFRQRNVEQFILAWNDAGSRTPADVDMLWHLLLTQTATKRDIDLQMLLRSNVRAYSNQGDTKRLAPMLATTMGAEAARQFVQDQINRTKDAFALRVLRDTLKKLQ